jgi:hypothetical protein
MLPAFELSRTSLDFVLGSGVREASENERPVAHMASYLVFCWQSQRDSNPCRHLERAVCFVPSVRSESLHVTFRQAKKERSPLNGPM